MTTRKIRLKRKQEPDKVTSKGTMTFVILILLTIVVFVVGVRLGVARKNSSLQGSSDLRSRGLYYQLKMARTHYHLGDPIEIKLTITNVTASPIPLKFPKNQEFDITVRKEVDLLFAQIPRIVWTLSPTKMVYAEPHVFVLDPGKSREYQATWNQIDRDGRAVSPGNYQIIGNLLADDRPEALVLRGKAEDQ